MYIRFGRPRDQCPLQNGRWHTEAIEIKQLHTKPIMDLRLDQHIEISDSLLAPIHPLTRFSSVALAASRTKPLFGTGFPFD
jgi:hypothetical protein